jgi:hypothetical protein
MVIKHPEKQPWGSNKIKCFPNVYLKVDTTKTGTWSILFEYCHLYRFRDKKECWFHATSLINQTEILSLAQGGVYRWWRKRFSLQQHFVRSYHCIWRQCWLNPSAFRYAIQLHQWCMCKICCLKTIRQWIYANNCNAETWHWIEKLCLRCRYLWSQQSHV